LLAAALGCCMLGGVGTAPQAAAPFQRTFVISGRISDPDKLSPPDRLLMLGSQDGDDGFTSTTVSVAADGSFVATGVAPATYVLRVVRMGPAAEQSGELIGLAIVPVTTADVEGVTVTIRGDAATIGRFRMEGDNVLAEPPPLMVVNACLALAGTGLLDCAASEPQGEDGFVLRNAFGPRVLRVGYSLAPGSPWWPSRVLLNGRDITNAPTDFTAHDRGALEVWFTQHPAALAGTVTGQHERPTGGAWVLVFSTDRSLWQPWATTSQAIQANAAGVFGLTMLPGEYRAVALPASAFASRLQALRDVSRFAAAGVTVQLRERERTRRWLSMGSLPE
jgi:hypothetical protein